MPFRSSSIQDRIMDTESKPSFFPFSNSRASTSRLAPSSAPPRLPPTHAPGMNLPHKTKWSQYWLSATSPSVWTKGTKERKDMDGISTEVDEGLLSRVIEEQNDRNFNERSNWGEGAAETERERKARQKIIRIRQMLEIGALFGIGAILVGLVVLCVSAGGVMRGVVDGREVGKVTGWKRYNDALLPYYPLNDIEKGSHLSIYYYPIVSKNLRAGDRGYLSTRHFGLNKKVALSDCALATFRGTAEDVEGALSNKLVLQDTTGRNVSELFIGSLAWHTDEKALRDKEGLPSLSSFASISNSTHSKTITTTDLGEAHETWKTQPSNYLEGSPDAIQTAESGRIVR
ncbi:hypothetical protein BDZ45DRAFT_759170 [Acephala macrosclerotiorum]|nr:hypothetical protein BDZ45DRAFT_759170 [Acephala macrosclerotiorum]